MPPSPPLARFAPPFTFLEFTELENSKTHSALADRARAMAAAQGTESAKLTADPELEMATENMAIIRWTTTNPGGTALHFGIVHYGTDPANLSQVAKSPNRRNQSHPDMIFRVRIAGLNPQTTYYYTIESTSSTGVSDGVSSPVRTFKTR
jgi:phosphodiesterase/alkaline phosphatase D-like protein